MKCLKWRKNKSWLQSNTFKAGVTSSKSAVSWNMRCFFLIITFSAHTNYSRKCCMFNPHLSSKHDHMTEPDFWAQTGRNPWGTVKYICLCLYLHLLQHLTWLHFLFSANMRGVFRRVLQPRRAGRVSMLTCLS